MISDITFDLLTSFNEATTMQSWKHSLGYTFVRAQWLQ